MSEEKRRPMQKPRERLGRALAVHMTEDFEAHGADLLSALRDDKPTEYLKLLQSILTQGAEKEAPGGREIKVVERKIIRPEPADG